MRTDGRQDRGRAERARLATDVQRERHRVSLPLRADHPGEPGGLALFTIEEGCHEERTLRTLAQLFDGRVRVREGPTGPEAQARGVDEFPGDWVAAGQGY